MSVVLLTGIAGLALLDALNPATIAGVALLLLSPLRRPVTAAALFALGAFTAVLALGVALLLGADVAAGAITDAMTWLRRAALLLGAGTLAVAGVRRFHTRTRAAVVLPVWVSARTALPLGVLVTGADLPNAFPYFIAIERIVNGDVGTTRSLVIIAGYALVYCLPCLLLLIAGAARGDRVRRRLGSLYERLGAEKKQPRSVPITVGYLVASAGVLTIALPA